MIQLPHYCSFRRKSVEEVLALLQPGTLVKIKGTRDGHGMREIIEVKSRKSTWWDEEQKKYVPCMYHEIVAWQINKVWYKRDENGVPHINKMERANQVTTHMLDKAVGLLGCNPKGRLEVVDRF